MVVPKVRLRDGRAIAGLLTALLSVLAVVGALLLLQKGPPPAIKGPSAMAAAELDKLPARPDDVAAQKLDPIGVDAARKINAETPFADLHPAPARAFRFSGTAGDRARALDCLALAAMAEAGGSDPGQRAVIQVVLNRVRHPAFAKTVCGVVFQGSLRATGCQFTFTCDGAMARRYSDAAWAAARRRAAEALDGRVYGPVGTATHYHTDWVHPVWSGELDKIARVETHLFFRWKGYWGTSGAARLAYRGGEPPIAQISWLPAHAAAAALAAASEAPMADSGGAPARGAQAGDRVGGGLVVTKNPQGAVYLVQLLGRPTRPAALSLGRSLCGNKGFCRVWAWTELGAVPKAFPIPADARDKLAFSYVFDTSSTEYVFYDCKRFANVPRDSCLPARF